MYIALLIILIIVGGVILWGALTGWTFSGIFGDAERDSPPGPISDVQVGVATGESGGRRESYTTYQQMEGLSITISFKTPKKSFGHGNSALKDYVISLGITNNQSRGDLLAVIVIPRNNATGARLITSTKEKIASGGIALSGDFNALDTRVSVTLSSPLWKDGEIIIREGGVFMGIDYTPMEMSEDYKWPGVKKFNEPAGEYTKYFISGGVTVIGAVEDGTGFVVDPDVTDSINEQLNFLYFRSGTTIDNAIQIDGKSGNFNEISVSDSVDNVVVPDGLVLELYRNGAWDPCSYITGNILPNRGQITHWNVKAISDIENDKFCAPRCTGATEDCLIVASYVGRGPAEFNHPSGYRLVMQGDGNLVIYKNYQAHWETATTGSGAVMYVMQDDGNLVLYDGGGSIPKWSSETGSSGTSKAPYGLYMNGDGRLAIKNKDGTPVWTDTTPPAACSNFTSSTDCPLYRCKWSSSWGGRCTDK